MDDPEFGVLARSCGAARNFPLYPSEKYCNSTDQFVAMRFVDLAIQHKATLTALLGLRKLDIPLESAAAKRLKTAALSAKLQRESMLPSACTILERLKAYGVPALILKGPAISLQLYGDPFAREYTDIDILANLSDLDRVIPLMEELGWIAKDYRPGGRSTAANSVLVQQEHHVVFWRKGSVFRVELHDRSSWGRELFRRDDIDSIFRHAELLNTAEGTFLAPSIADHALLILAHGTKHAWCKLQWALDAAALLSLENEALYTTLASRVMALDMGRQLKLICELIPRLYPIKISKILEATFLDERGLDKSVDFAYAQLRSGGKDMGSMANVLAFQAVYALPLLRSPRDKIASILQLAKVPRKDMEALPLPRPLRFIHLLMRPFFIVSRRIGKIRRNRTAPHRL